MTTDWDNLTDEELANMAGPPANSSNDEAIVEDDDNGQQTNSDSDDDSGNDESASDDGQSGEIQSGTDEPGSDDNDVSALSDDDLGDTPPSGSKPGEDAKLKQPSEPDASKPVEGAETPTDGQDGDTPPGDAPKVETAPKPAYATYTPEQKAAAFDALMKPFKAAGKQISLESPEELLQLAQLGADYTKKMQQIAPARRLAQTLQNAGIVDPERLNLLIEAHNKKPEAIAKLLQEAEIDPLEIDVSSKTDYKPTNHQVSDVQVEFTDTLRDVLSTESGKETVRDIETNWDEASRKHLIENPKNLKAIHEQYETGVYQQIATEMERRRTLGKLDSRTPYLVAYKEIGDQLHEAGRLLVNGVPTNKPAAVAPQPVPRQEPPVAQKPAPLPLERRANKPKSAVTNNQQARAAAPNRASAPKAESAPNYEYMTDEEFAKIANMRL